ncbi:MAG: hypothetical protein N3A64_03920 [Desulfobacterota bacterium]|nr:hypothetical protein [Thermodesulfobacteriota bacterium]
MILRIMIVMVIVATIFLGNTEVSLAEQQDEPLLSQSGNHCASNPIPFKIDSGDTAWVLISTALVMLMTPGLAFFYSGMLGRKNVLSILMQCFIILCVISILLSLIQI